MEPNDTLPEFDMDLKQVLVYSQRYLDKRMEPNNITASHLAHIGWVNCVVGPGGSSQRGLVSGRFLSDTSDDEITIWIADVVAQSDCS